MLFLAEVPHATPDWFTPLLQLGGVGACLVWFMFRSEPRLRAIEAAIDRFSRTLIVLSFAIANALEAIQWHAAKSIKLQAEPIDRELDQAEKGRGANT
jgi:hypothetical protein